MTFEQLPEKVAEIDVKLDQLLHLFSTKPEIEEPESWLTLEALCEYLGDPQRALPKATVYGWVAKNSIPYNKRGKRLYFNKKEIDIWLRESR